jgi:hypothetical protein
MIEGSKECTGANAESSDADDAAVVAPPLNNVFKKHRNDTDAKSTSSNSDKRSIGNVSAKTKLGDKKTEFHLRKPGNDSAGKQRLNIHEMFLQTQLKQTQLEEKKILVSAVADLAKAGVQPADIPLYLEIMGLNTKPKEADAAANIDD